ncbi:hypothetical protein, partial [Mesomycoplasma hyorhinis]|uniref:hypothetical protein n=1 Tax=Mesomycoplasma hyorhinis TaxID=2100 RepID=UPI001C05989C
IIMCLRACSGGVAGVGGRRGRVFLWRYLVWVAVISRVGGVVCFAYRWYCLGILGCQRLEVYVFFRALHRRYSNQVHIVGSASDVYRRQDYNYSKKKKK